MALPLPALLSGGVSLVNAIMQGNAIGNQRNLSYQNLNEQKRQAAEREKLAKAPREDAFGNRIVYREGEGFVIENTALTDAILNAQQKEQLAQFRQDAPRQRQAAERMDRRSKEADDFFQEQFNKNRYRRHRSREEYEAEAIRDVLDTRRDDNSNDALQALTRAALRTNNSSAIPEIVKASKNMSTEQTLAEAIAQAKKQGRQQYLAETNAENDVAFSELNNLRSIADTTSNNPLNFSNQNNALSSNASNALQTLISTNSTNANAIANAMSSASNAAGKTVDLSSIANILGNISLEEKQTPEEKQLADLLLQQQMSDAEYGIAKNEYRTNRGIF